MIMLNKQIYSEKKKYVPDFPAVSLSFPAANVSWTDIIFKARDNKALIKP